MVARAIWARRTGGLERRIVLSIDKNVHPIIAPAKDAGRDYNHRRLFGCVLGDMDGLMNAMVISHPRVLHCR